MEVDEITDGEEVVSSPDADRSPALRGACGERRPGVGEPALDDDFAGAEFDAGAQTAGIGRDGTDGYQVGGDEDRPDRPGLDRLAGIDRPGVVQTSTVACQRDRALAVVVSAWRIAPMTRIAAARITRTGPIR